MVFPSGSEANAQGTWLLAGTPEGYEADNSDDGTPNLLRVPFAFPDDADGLWLTTTRDGEQARTFFGLNRYAAAEEIPIRAAGESLEIRYHNEFDGEKPTISAKVLKGPLGESVTLSVALAVATPAIGIRQAALDTINREIATLTERLDDLPSEGETVTLPARASAAELAALASTALRLFSPRDLGTAIEGKTTRPTGLSYDNSNRTLTLNYVRNGVAEHLTAGPWPAPTSGAATAPHDFQQVGSEADLNAANASETVLITSAFTAGTVSWMVGDIGVNNGTAWIRIGSVSPELSAGSVTTSILADDAVTLAKLSAALRTTLAGKADTTALPAAIRSDSTVAGLRSFEAALRTTSHALSQTARAATGNAYVELPGSWPELQEDDILTARLQETSQGIDVSNTFYSSALYAKQASNAAQASDANGIRWTDSNNDAYTVSRLGGRGVLFAPPSPGDWTLTVTLDRIEIQENQLSQAVRTKLDAVAVPFTEADARRIADEEIAKNLKNVDVVARKTVRFARPSVGEDIQINAALGFQISSTNFTLGQISQDDEGSITFGINNVGTRDQLLGYEVKVGDETYDFSTMQYSRGSGANDGSSPDGYSTPNGQPTLSTTADTTIEIVEPIGKENYVPGTGVAGYPLVKNAGDSVQSTFQQLRTVGYAGRSVTSAVLAENAVENDNILANAVSPDKIHPRGRLPDATSLDAGRVPRTTATSSYETVPVDNSFLKRWVGTSAQLPAADQRDADVFYYVVSS